MSKISIEKRDYHKSQVDSIILIKGEKRGTAAFSLLVSILVFVSSVIFQFTHEIVSRCFSCAADSHMNSLE